MTFAFAFTLFVICIGLESLTSWMFIKGSQRNYPELWEHAGMPTLLGNGDLISAYALIRYLWDRDYYSVGDNQAVAFADRMRVPAVASYATAWIACITLLIVVFL